jgi:hypothetical protein
VQQARPRLAWFSLGTPGRDGPVPGLRFFPLPDYPAPAWRLDVLEWPEGQNPVLDAWWVEDKLQETAVLRRGTDFTTLSELQQKPLKIRPTDEDEQVRVLLESVTYERLPVEVDPRAPEKTKDMDCLVVRMRCLDKHKPFFFVQLPDALKPVGYEHRFYEEAGKYTGVFWGVKEKEVQNLQSLGILSVEDLRRKLSVTKLEITRPGPPPGPPADFRR